MTSLLFAIALSAPAQATAIHEQADLPDGAEVSVENICGTITIAGVERTGVVLRGELEEGAELTVSRDAKRVNIRVESENTLFGWGESACATLRLEVPIHTALSIESVSSNVAIGGLHAAVAIDVVSGDLQIGDGPTEVDIESVSGDITLKGVETELTIESVSGDIELSGVHGRVDIQSVSGDIAINGTAFQRVEVETVSGDIEFEGDLEKNARLEMASHSGDVTLKLPATTSASFEMESFSGSIRLADGKNIGGSVPGTSARHTMGSGEAEVSLSTFSGEIMLTP